MSIITKNKNTLDNFATALENCHMPHLRAIPHAFYIMMAPLSWYAILVVRSSRVIMPYHRTVSVTPQRIPPMMGTMNVRMRY